MSIIKDSRGQILVEFGLIIPIFAGMVMMIIIISLWLYNSTQVSQAARLAAHYLATTGKGDEAQQVAFNYLTQKSVISTTTDIVVYWNGDVACATAETEMETFFPGLPKLFNPSGPMWTDKVIISKEAVTTGEYRFRSENSQLFN